VSSERQPVGHLTCWECGQVWCIWFEAERKTFEMMLDLHMATHRLRRPRPLPVRQNHGDED